MTREEAGKLKAVDEAYRTRSAAHVARYIASDGKDGYDDNRLKAPTLLLTTTGRKSGKPFTTPLNFQEHEGRFLLIASKGGSDRNPQWYLNLVNDPHVTVQILAKTFPAVARTAGAEEKEHLWPIMGNRMPFYNEYREATERDIPLIVLDPDPASGETGHGGLLGMARESAGDDAATG